MISIDSNTLLVVNKQYIADSTQQILQAAVKIYSERSTGRKNNHFTVIIIIISIIIII